MALRTPLLAFFVLITGCQSADVRSEVASVLERQQAAWNRGDINGFMETYWKSDRLTFLSTSKTENPNSPEPAEETTESKGWDATLERYRTRYPTRDAMGELAFTLGEIQLEGKDKATLDGRYQLTRKDEFLTGSFVLNLELMDGTWIIVRDHTRAD